MKLIIIRGPSGSGKTTIARHLGGIEGINWLEADMFFMRNGIYQFDLTRLGDAHAWCQNLVQRSLAQNAAKEDSDVYWRSIGLANPKPSIVRDTIVSNTSTTLKELNVYIKMAEELDVDYAIIRSPEPWILSNLAARNTHRVPQDILHRQIKRYEPHDEEKEWDNMEIFNA